MTTSPNTTASPSPFRFLIWSGAVLLALIAISQFLLPGQQGAPESLPSLASVPPFNLTERSGRTISNNDLDGKIWVADFIFTTCPGPCPLITAGMVKLQTALHNDPEVELVTFTVDPEDDTPSVLAAYANKYGADPEHWWFLTGPEKPLYSLVHDGFLQIITDNRGQQLQEGEYIFTHSTRLALVDGHGTIRGFYDGLTETGRAQLLQAIQILKKEN